MLCGIFSHFYLRHLSTFWRRLLRVRRFHYNIITSSFIILHFNFEKTKLSSSIYLFLSHHTKVVLSCNDVLNHFLSCSANNTLGLILNTFKWYVCFFYVEKLKRFFIQ